MEEKVLKALEALSVLEGEKDDNKTNTTLIRKHIAKLEDKVEELRDTNSELSSELRTSEDVAEHATERAEEAEAELQEKMPQNLYDEIKEKITLRLFENCTLQQLDELEAAAKQMVKNYKDF